MFRHIVKECDTEEEAYSLEAKLITMYQVNSGKFYNKVAGGLGYQTGKNNPMYGKKGEDSPLYGITTKESKQKMSKSKIGTKNPKAKAVIFDSLLYGVKNMLQKR